MLNHAGNHASEHAGNNSKNLKTKDSLGPFTRAISLCFLVDV
jgi:hypothetical protein